MFLNEIANKTTGTLSLVHYLSNDLCIEWRPNDHYMIADADAQEQDDWSLVDTIEKRQRTASECAVFNSTQSNTQIPGDEKPSGSQSKTKLLRILIRDLKCIEVLKSGHLFRLISKSDGKANSEYFFQNGNADGFVRTMQTTHCLRRSRNHRGHYDIISYIERDKEILQKTFTELKLDDIKGQHGGSWISTMVRHPFEHTIDFLAKMSDVYTYPVSDQNEKQSPADPELINSKSMTSNTDEYEVLSTSPRQNDGVGSPKLPPRPIVARGQPLSAQQWQDFQSEDGRILEMNHVKEVIFRGGIESDLRKEVWKFLLSYYDWDATTEQRANHRAKKEKEYYQMKMQWLSLSEMQERNFSDYRDRKCQIEKDVKRTDRTLDFFSGDENPNLSRLQDILMTYVMYNFDLGYVQGMSDLLAPILSTMDSEVSFNQIRSVEKNLKSNNFYFCSHFSQMLSGVSSVSWT